MAFQFQPEPNLVVFGTNLWYHLHVDLYPDPSDQERVANAPNYTEAFIQVYKMNIGRWAQYLSRLRTTIAVFVIQDIIYERHSRAMTNKFAQALNLIAMQLLKENYPKIHIWTSGSELATKMHTLLGRETFESNVGQAHHLSYPMYKLQMNLLFNFLYNKDCIHS